MMKPLIASTLSVLIISLMLTACTAPGWLEKAVATPTPPAVDPAHAADFEAIQSALARATGEREDVLTFLIYDVKIDQIEFIDDQNLAVVWLAVVDPSTGELLPAEAGMAIAQRVDSKSPAPDWRIHLQADEDWWQWLGMIPDTVIPADVRDRYLPNVQAEPKAHQVFSGYRLPWKSGESIRLSGSIGHVFTYKTCPSACLYAFDFANGTMFDVHAARSGRVKYVVWQYPNGNSKHANYIVLEDTTTNPTTYQVYYHLAQDSVPPQFRVIGAEVLQGQFIGNADDTGPSTGHHLHFHVHTNSALYWGNSVDITFDDVKINGGRPRTCSEAAQFPGYGAQCNAKDMFVSGNGDTQRPTGGISAPTANTVITKPVFNVSVWAKDDTAVDRTQLYITNSGEWKPVGSPQGGTSFNVSVDLCQLEIGPGEFFLTVSVLDRAGKYSQGLSGLTRLTNKFDCHPAPKVCNPTADQVAIFDGANFTGKCEVLPVGEYASGKLLGEVGDNRIASVRVGSNVFASLFDLPDYAGTVEYTSISDGNLADNAIGAQKISSLKVQPLPPLPGAPILEPPLTMQGMPPTDQDNLVLNWYTGGEAVDTNGVPGVTANQYRVELSGPNGLLRDVDWQAGTTWQVGALPVGDYIWTVHARNLRGFAYTQDHFSVLPVDYPPVTHLNPLDETQQGNAIHLTWAVDQGVEDMRMFELEYRVNGGAWQLYDGALGAHLRETWFMGAPGQTYEFRLRGVDSKDHAEEFPPLAEATVTLAATCEPDEYDANGKNDDSLAESTPIDPGQQQAHNLCGAFDEDWLMFPAQEGKLYRISTNPLSGGAGVNIQLYNLEASKVLGMADAPAMNSGSQLEWTAPEDGFYAVRLIPMDNRLQGTNVRYKVRVETTGQVFPPGLFCSGAVLPVLWGLAKLLLRWREKKFAEKYGE